MTIEQAKLYWWEWGEVKRFWKKKDGYVATEEDRRMLHRRALGHDKSSKDFTNGEFSAVLATFRAQSQPDNFKEQLRLAGDDGDRCRGLELRVGWLSMELGLRKGEEERYVGGIIRNVFKVDAVVGELEERQLQKLEGILMRRLKTVRGAAEAERIFGELKAKAAEQVVEENAKNNPF